VDVSYSGKVLLSRVLRSEGVAEAPFQPVVEELPCHELSEEDAPVVTGAYVPVSAYVPAPSAPAAPSARPVPEAIVMPSARKPFPVRMAGLAAASVLVIAVGFGAWHATRGARQPVAAVATARPPEPTAVSPSVTAEPSKLEPASPSVAAPPIDSNPPPVSAAPPNYLLCAFGTGTTVFGTPRTLTLAQIMNGLQANCGFSGTGATYDVTIHWIFSGEPRTESTKTTTVAVGDAVSVKTSGPEWVHGGPMEAGLLQVTIDSVRRSDGRMNTWTGVVRLTR
jgi:hypothetical protein